MDRDVARLHRLATSFFIAAIERHGFPSTDGDTGALAKDCFHAAQILIKEGQRMEAVILGAKAGKP